MPRTLTSPVLSFDPELLLKAQCVKVVFFDVDGVFTDGGITLSESGEEPRVAESSKRFHTLDGHGLKMLMRAGITPAVITGRDSVVLRARLDSLGVRHARFGTEDKAPAAESLLSELGLDWSVSAAMGDDWPDLPMLCRAAFACAPPQAHAEVLARVDHVTAAAGGQGAVREMCDLLLTAQGRYASALSEYLR